MTTQIAPTVAADPNVVETYLAHMYANVPGLVSICSDADRFAGRRFTTDRQGISRAAQYVATLDQSQPKGIYAQVTTLSSNPESGRGGEEHAHAISYLWADGDFGSAGHSPGKDDLPHPPDADTVRQITANSGLPEATGWVRSGGGENPVWMFTAPYVIADAADRERIKAFTAGAQAILGSAAYRAGYTWDVGVGDLARLMRLPGTVNRKTPEGRPVTLAEGAGVIYTVDELIEIVDRLAPAAHAVMAEAAREKQERAAARQQRPMPAPRAPSSTSRFSGSGPLDVLADTLRFGDILEPEGWTFEGWSGGREKWLRAAGADGKASSEYSLLCDDHVAVNWSERSDLPVGAQPPGKKLTVGTVYAHLHYGGDVSAAAKDIMRAAAGLSTAGPASKLPPFVLAEVKRRCLQSGGRLPRPAPPGAAFTAPDDPFEYSGMGEPEPGAEEEEAPTRRITLTPASSVKIRPVRWLWDTTPVGHPPTSHGRIPMYSLAIAAGGPGLGKSQWAVWLTAQITRGTLPGQLYGKPRAVIYAATEDSWTYTIAPRLIAAGADLDLVFRIDVRDDEKMTARLTLPSDISLLGKAAEEYGVALFVADPLLSLIDSGINDYRAAEVREALEPLVACAERHGFTIVGLAHFTKSGNSDPVNRIAGSGAFGQLIRSLTAFAQQENEDGDPEFVMSLEKNNLGMLGLPSFKYMIQPVTVPTEEGPSYVSRFVLGGESSTSVRDALRAADGPPGADRAELSEAAAWLRDYLEDDRRGGAAPPKDIEQAARAAGITPTALRTAKTKLKVVSVKPKALNAPWVWQLPTTQAESDDPEPT